MPADARELQQVLRTGLLASAVLRTLVDDRVYGGHLEDAEAGTVVMPLVIVELLSGFAMYNRSVSRTGFDLWAYSKRSADEAHEVYDASFRAVQAECLGVVGVGTHALARETERPVDGWNELLRAWFVRGRWVANAAATPG